MAKILVTGATGFVGQALVPHLLQQGHDVIATYRSHKGDAACDWLHIPDIGPKTDWSGKLEGVDQIIHLAARVHMMNETSDNPLDIYRDANRYATTRLAEEAAKQGVKRFVFLSSIKVNGEATEPTHPFEAAVPNPPQDPYGLSKWEAEQDLKDIAQKSDMEVCTLRPPLVYGPGVKANFLSLIKLADKGLPVPFGSLHNLRSLVYVGNLVDALSVCAHHKDAANKTYLVSDQQDLSVAQMFGLMAKSLGRPARMIPVPVFLLQALGVISGKRAAIDRLSQFLQLDSRPLSDDLGWKPPYSAESGFQKTIDWYKG